MNGSASLQRGAEDDRPDLKDDGGRLVVDHHLQRGCAVSRGNVDRGDRTFALDEIRPRLAFTCAAAVLLARRIRILGDRGEHGADIDGRRSHQRHHLGIPELVDIGRGIEGGIGAAGPTRVAVVLDLATGQARHGDDQDRDDCEKT